jgi:catechol 2,3-dioxygenase-like lactoylglutathione lyase family enzyme
MPARARAIGLNHIALEVGDLDAALEFYGRLFSFDLRGRIDSRMAFIDLGDQFIAIAAGRSQDPDAHRHFGLVVDDKAAVRTALEEAGVEVLPGRGLDFLDPWGNRFEIVQYDEIQFSKAPAVLRGMDLAGLGKTAAARDELARKGLA